MTYEPAGGAYSAWPPFDVQDLVVMYSESNWRPLRILYVEPLPASTPLRQDLGAVAAATTVASTRITVLALQENNLLAVRFRPIDDVELLAFLQQGTRKFWIRDSHTRIGRSTGLTDEEWRATTTFILGRDRDLFLEVRNPTDYNLPASRVQFWGWRAYVQHLDDGWTIDLNDLVLIGPPSIPRAPALTAGPRSWVLNSPWNGRPVVWLSGEGRGG